MECLAPQTNLLAHISKRGHALFMYLGAAPVWSRHPALGPLRGMASSLE
jgi:hypothetical protein